jgi:hypothetical protein
MVPLLLLMNARTRQDARPALRRCFQAPVIGLAIASLGPSLQAQTFVTNIATTTYLDSWVINQTNNYGHAHTVKVVIDGMGQSDPTKDGSICRGLFQFPPQLWSYSPSDIVSASVSFYVWQDYTTNRNVTLYPLTRSFVQGTGDGTYPPDGATWFTYDGVNPWTNPGGDFDTNYSVIAVKGPILTDENDRFFYWDVTASLQNPASRAELQNYGAILRIDETPVPTTGMPRAPFTSAYDPSYTPAYWPTLQLTVRPTVFNVVISGGAISLGITNLTVGVTNTIERSFTLATNGWTAVTNIVATGISTNWSEPIQPGWTNAFYRVLSQF